MANILIVDDETSVNTLLGNALEKEGHTIFSADNGVKGLSIYNSNNIDLVITDLVMPEKGGIEMIMDLKKQKPDIKIIAISGGGGITGRFDYLPIAQLVGASHVISKPFELSDIRSQVAQLLAS
ncbi:MAG: response regulator [Gammaproteobacteria bacterium]|nr:response regulator [Gammaproteobacteria bacterium]